MEEYKWGFVITTKAGQNVKKKKQAIEVTDKDPEHSLKVSITATEESVDAVLRDIIDKVGEVVSVTITKEGSEADLQDEVKSIANIIAKHGKQTALDIHFDNEKVIA